MQRMGTTAHGAVASTNCSSFWLGGAAQRLGERRSLSSHKTSFIGSDIGISQPQRLPHRRRDGVQIRSALFDPPPFDPAKLSIRYLPGTAATDISVPHSRRYTLTHNDLTGRLHLSVGLEYNSDQLAGWYTRIVRDEVLAEWAVHPSNAAPPRLNIYCHVSGEELWPAPPALRSFIFQREMKLVLDTIAYADRRLLAEHSSLASATVFVHLVSDLTALNKVVEWGSLGDRSTWLDAGVGKNIFNELVSSISGSVSSIDGEEQQLHPPPPPPPSSPLQQQQQQEHSKEEIVEDHESSSPSETKAVSTMQSVAAAPAPREVERRTTTLAGRARGVVTAAMSRSTPATAANTRRQQ